MKLFNNSAVLTTIATICAVSAAFQSVTPSAGHATLQVPASRNYYASIDFKNDQVKGGGTNDPTHDAPNGGLAFMEDNPTALDQNTGVCGKTQTAATQKGTGDYDQWLDWQGHPMPWKSQETYTAGQIITVKIFMATNHEGHFQLRGCPVEEGSSPSEECFRKYPLQFMEDVTHGMPVDTNHPDWAYIFGGESVNNVLMEYKFKLPDNLSGEKVLLQYFWYTGQRCMLADYKKYVGMKQLNWSNNDGTEDCPTGTYPYDGHPFDNTDAGNPEFFVNCAEVTINSNSRRSALRSF